MPKQFAGWRPIGLKEFFRKGDVIAYVKIQGHNNSTPDKGEPVHQDYWGGTTPGDWNWNEDIYWTAYRKDDGSFVSNLPDKPLFKIKLPLP